MPSSSQEALELDGTPTEVVLQWFADRVVVLVTQLGKVGCLVRLNPTRVFFSNPCKMQATMPPTAPLLPPLNDDTLPEPPISIQLTPLFGQPPTEHLHTLHALYASQISTGAEKGM